jgi:hypothetical protein
MVCCQADRRGRGASARLPANRMLAGRRCGGHGAGDLAEDRADAGSNARHNRACGNRDETCHQSILNEVLSSVVVPNSQLPHQISNACHFLCLLLSPRRISSATTSKLSPEAGMIPSVKALRTVMNSPTGIPFESWSGCSTLGGDPLNVLSYLPCFFRLAAQYAFMRWDCALRPARDRLDQRYAVESSFSCPHIKGSSSERC